MDHEHIQICDISPVLTAVHFDQAPGTWYLSTAYEEFRRWPCNLVYMLGTVVFMPEEHASLVSAAESPRTNPPYAMIAASSSRSIVPPSAFFITISHSCTGTGRLEVRLAVDVPGASAFPRPVFPWRREHRPTAAVCNIDHPSSDENSESRSCTICPNQTSQGRNTCGCGAIGKMQECRNAG